MYTQTINQSRLAKRVDRPRGEDEAQVQHKHCLDRKKYLCGRLWICTGISTIGRRSRRGWSQSYVAEKIDVSINTVSSIENGAQQFNLAILLQFSMLYGVSTDYILSGKKQEIQDCGLVERISQIPIMERRRVMAAIEAFYA